MISKEMFAKNMLKISDVADRLGVERYVIFEKMTIHADLLDEHIHKIQSIMYIDIEGVSVLSDIIYGKEDSDISSSISENIKDVVEEQEVDDDQVTLLADDEYTIDSLSVDIEIFEDEKNFLNKLGFLEQECNALENDIQKCKKLMIDLDKSIMKLEYEIRDALQQKKMIVKSKENNSV